MPWYVIAAMLLAGLAVMWWLCHEFAEEAEPVLYELHRGGEPLNIHIVTTAPQWVATQCGWTYDEARDVIVDTAGNEWRSTA